MVDASDITIVTSVPRRKVAKWRRYLSGWTFLGLFVAFIVVLPIATVFWLALFPTENIWPHLLATTLPRYLGNSLLMMAGVGTLAAVIGTGSAWLVVMYRFPGRNILQWALLLPLSLPAYIAAFALVDFLEYAGPLQTWLRYVFGWTSPRDYMFPEIRSRGIAILVLAFALYPYVYFLTRSVFRTQSGAAIDVARALGCGPVSSFFRVGLPLARPAVVASVAIVMMETLNEFGAMEFFAVQTLTTGIFSVWLEANNAGGAAQIASVILVFILLLVLSEKYSRRRIKFHETARNMRPPQPQELSRKASFLAFAFCALPVLVGFVLPLSILAHHAFSRSAQWGDPELWQATGHTILVAVLAVTVTVSAGTALVFSVRLAQSPFLTRLLPITTIGYAAPGAVLALGIMIPLAALDHTLADTILWLTGTDPGLLLIGSMGALVLAYSVRFFAIAVGTIDAAFTKVSPSLAMASRSLGRNPRETLLYVFFPLIRGAVGTAALLVFVDCTKELPATLLLYSKGTLATSAFKHASLEDIAGATPAALLIVLISLVAVAAVSFSGQDKN
jgi:iron(III) transport system permease protein